MAGLDDVKNITDICNSCFAGNVQANPISLNPSNPLASIYSNNQRFTVFGDNQHGNPDIVQALNAQLPALAEAGYKKLILEYGMDSIDELSSSYPALVGLSTSEAVQVIDEYTNSVFDQIGQEVASKLTAENKEFSDENWNQAWEQAQIGFATELNDLYNAFNALKTRDLLDRWFSDPALATAAEIRENAYLFNSANSQSPDEASQVGMNYAELLINAQSLGIKVILAGDYPAQEQFELREKLEQEQFEFIENNSELDQRYRQSLENTDYFEQLSPIEQQEVLNYGDTLSSFHEQWMDLSQQIESIRFSDEALLGRAERFMDISNGEKTVVLWGAAHFNGSTNSLDINEYLDGLLKQEAYKNATLDSFQPTVRIDLHASREQLTSDTEMGINGIDQALMNFFVKENELEITNEGSERIEILPNQEIPDFSSDVQNPYQGMHMSQ